MNIFNDIAKRWQLRYFNAFNEMTDGWYHCSKCGGTMESSVMPDHWAGYSRSTGEMKSFLLNHQCHIAVLEDEWQHDALRKRIYLNPFTISWLIRNKHMPGTKSILDAIKEESKQNLPVW
jgi:hypothetical protein